MYKEVVIVRVDGSEDPTPLLANAATPRRFKQIFHKDLLTLFANSQKQDEDGGKIYNIDFIAELTFVMAMQAQAREDSKIKLDKLNDNSLLDWLEQYDGMSIENAVQDILDVYFSNANSESESKKNNEEQSEK